MPYSWVRCSVVRMVRMVGMVYMVCMVRATSADVCAGYQDQYFLNYPIVWYIDLTRCCAHKWLLLLHVMCEWTCLMCRRITSVTETREMWLIRHYFPCTLALISHVICTLLYTYMCMCSLCTSHWMCCSHRTIAKKHEMHCSGMCNNLKPSTCCLDITLGDNLECRCWTLYVM